MADEEFVSLNPETFTEGGGGLINDVDGEFGNFQFAMINPNARELTPGDVPYLTADFTTEDDTYGMRWSCGGAANWDVGAGGNSLKAKGTQKGVNKGSNLGLFLTSLYNSGFPKDKLGNDIRVLNGLQAHIIRIPEPERKGLNRPVRADGREGGGIVTISKINKLPWEKAATAKGAGGKKPSAKPAAASEALESEVVGIILTALADSPEGVAKKDVIKSVVAQASTESRGAAMQMANNDTWLKGRSEWAFENGVIRLP